MDSMEWNVEEPGPSLATMRDAGNNRPVNVPMFNVGGKAAPADTGVPSFNLGNGTDGGNTAVQGVRDELAARIGTIRDTANKVNGASRPRLSKAPDFRAMMRDATSAPDAAVADQQAARAQNAIVPGIPATQAPASAPAEPVDRIGNFLGTRHGGILASRFGANARSVIEGAEADMARAMGL